MRFARMHVLAFVSLFLAFPVFAQQTATIVRRDPQALLVLQQCLSAAGGSTALSAIQDVTGTGSITYFWAGQQVQGTVTVRDRGTGQFRLDANLSAGTRSWAVSNGDGSLKDTDGTTSDIPFHNAMSLGGLTFPFLAIATAAQNASTSVLDLGLVTADGRQARQIRVQQNLPSATELQRTFSKLATKDFFVDATSFQLLKIQDVTHPPKNFTEDYSHEIYFSDYRTVNGVLVPFGISEKIAGQQTWVVQLTQVTFNNNPSDLDFQL
jgi:hypothetical protein